MSPELQHALTIVAYVIAGLIVLGVLVYATIAIVAVRLFGKARKSFDSNMNELRKRSL